MMVLCASCVSIFAQESTNVSYNDAKETYGYMNPIVSGVPSMSISPDAVAGGMGDVGVATNSDMNSQYWNSSKYAQNESSAGFAFSYTPWLRKLGVNDINLLNKFVWNKLLQKNPSDLVSPPQISYYG